MTPNERQAVQGEAPVRAAAERDLPLVVDLDGTLTPADTLAEATLKLVRANPLAVLALPFWLAAGRATLKHRLTDRAMVDVALLPYDPAVLDRIRTARAAGRRIVLATASDLRVAEAVAAHLGLFDEVVATASGTNLSAGRKRDALVGRFDEGGFDYIGNARADRPVWAAARRAIVANAPAALARAVTRTHPAAETLAPRPAPLPRLVRAARPYQWVKNLLLFVAAFASHQVEATHLGLAAIGFVAFGLAASAGYLVNDLLDIEADRRHPRKRTRPFAAGRVPVETGLATAFALVVAAFAVGALLPARFLSWLAIYVVVNALYSFWLKRHGMIDVIVLAGLYTVRILAGGAAIGIEISLWLLAFSMFLFASLAFAKRYPEVAALDRGGDPEARVRGYRPGDAAVLLAFGAGSGIAAVLTLALYVNAGTSGLYHRPEYLWGICPILLYWIARLWIAASRGTLTDDPILFALKDRVSLAVMVLAVIPVVLAL